MYLFMNLDCFAGARNDAGAGRQDRCVHKRL